MDKKGRLVFRKMRKGLRIPQAQLAKEVGLYRSKITEWENGNIDLTPDEELRIGDAIDRVLAKRGLPGVVTPEQAREDSREGAVLARLRVQYGFTQAQLAQKTKTDQGSISAFEKGHLDLSPDKIAQLFQALDSLIEGRRTQREVLENYAERVPSKRHSKKPLEGATVVGPSQVRMGNLRDFGQPHSLSDLAAPQEVQRLKARLQTMQELISEQKELITCLKEFVALHEDESKEKDIRVATLEKKVADLRNLYEIETEVAVKGAQAEELRERLSAVPSVKEDK